MLKRADSSIKKQMDLVRYIKLQRFHWLSAPLLLKPPQLDLMEKVATMQIRESSDLDRGSEDDF